MRNLQNSELGNLENSNVGNFQKFHNGTSAGYSGAASPVPRLFLSPVNHLLFFIDTVFMPISGGL